MTQFSMLWETQTGTGDGAYSYTQLQSNNYFRYFDTQDPTKQGVLYEAGGLGSLKVTGDSFPLNVESGAAVCWLRYWNDSATTVTESIPVSDTGGRVILETDWATNTTRLKIILNTTGVTTPPALTQTVDVLWQISLAVFVVDSAGDVFTDSGKLTDGVVDSRHFIVSPSSGMIKLREAGYIFTEPGTMRMSYIQDDLTHLRLYINGACLAAGGNERVYLTINGITSGYTWHSDVHKTGGDTSTESLSDTNWKDMGIAASGAAVPTIVDFPYYAFQETSVRRFQSLSTFTTGFAGANAFIRLAAFGSVTSADAIHEIEIKLSTSTWRNTGAAIATLYGFK